MEYISGSSSGSDRSLIKSYVEVTSKIPLKELPPVLDLLTQRLRTGFRVELCAANIAHYDEDLL